MSAILDAALIAAALAVAMLGAIEVGFRTGWRRRALDESAKSQTSAVEGAIFALFGLLLAFNFSTAGGRMDARRQLVISEANAIGTAWLRLDYLPADAQAAIRPLMREYLSQRIAVHRALPDQKQADVEMAKVNALQDQIWKRVTLATVNETRPQILAMVVPPMNDMFDVGSERFFIARFHSPWAVVGGMLALAVLASFLAGHAMSHRAGRPWLHIMLFVVVVSATIYITLDMEFPRSGLVNIRDADVSLILLKEQLAG